MRTRIAIIALFTCAVASWAGRDALSDPTPSDSTSGARVIELTADHDSRYRQGRTTSPTIEVSANEPLILRITAIRAHEVARDGSIHGLALLDKNSNTLPGWKFFLHPGVQDIAVTAPSEPGRYKAVCTVICSDGHEDMGFTVIVVDRKTEPKTDPTPDQKGKT
jgi:heme/copper-type cytochrome/quinol oxidase subunit 2